MGTHRKTPGGSLASQTRLAGRAPGSVEDDASETIKKGPAPEYRGDSVENNLNTLSRPRLSGR